MKFLRRRFVRVLLVMGILLLAAFLFRRPLLTAAASGWVVSDSPQSAAAILVLGGDVDSRPFTAARLYKEGYAPKILLTQVKPSATEALGLRKRETEIAREVLLKEGVPAAAIELIGQDVSSTFDEVNAVLTWLKTNAAPSDSEIMIPTGSFCTRRTRWIFEKKLAGAAVPRIIEIPSRTYSAENWWEHEAGLIDFQNEVIKHLYYRFKY